MPKTFTDFVEELEHIKGKCEGRTLVFRGQANHRWLLDSTFVRSCKRILLDVAPWTRPSKEVREGSHQAYFALFLFKFDLLATIS